MFGKPGCVSCISGWKSINQNGWGSVSTQKCSQFNSVGRDQERSNAGNMYANAHFAMWGKKKKIYTASKFFLFFTYFPELLLFCIFFFDICIFDFNKSSTVSWVNGVAFNLLAYFLPEQIMYLLLVAERAICPGFFSDVWSCCACTTKWSWAEFSHDAPSFSCDTDVMSMLRSSKASQNHWIYCECTRTDLVGWSASYMT